LLFLEVSFTFYLKRKGRDIDIIEKYSTLYSKRIKLVFFLKEIDMSKIIVGVGVIITKEEKVLLGKRKGSHGSGTWGLPGGHLEYGETVEECACREALEETGLHIYKTKQETFTTDFFHEENKEAKHYITLFVSAQKWDGTPKVMEPNKCATWDWFEWDNLPSPLFIPVRNLLSNGFTLS